MSPLNQELHPPPLVPYSDSTSGSDTESSVGLGGHLAPLIQRRVTWAPFPNRDTLPHFTLGVHRTSVLTVPPPSIPSGLIPQEFSDEEGVYDNEQEGFTDPDPNRMSDQSSVVLDEKEAPDYDEEGWSDLEDNHVPPAHVFNSEDPIGR